MRMLWVLAIGLPVLCGMGRAETEPPVRRLGGCQTTRRAYGLPEATDSLAAGAVDELLAPGEGPKPGPFCRALGADTPLFVEIGAVDSLADQVWAGLAGAATSRIAECELHLAERTLLGHTTGPCFPPYHVELRACGDSASVAAFLETLGAVSWPALTGAQKPSEREIFVEAGTSLQFMPYRVDLRRVPDTRGEKGGETGSGSDGETGGETGSEAGRGNP
jgi:hypothetical protein